MSNRYRHVATGVVVPVLIAGFGLFDLRQRPTFATFHRVDVFQLIVCGMCLGIALTGLIEFSSLALGLIYPGVLSNGHKFILPEGDVQVRIAEEGDVDAIVRLINAAFVVERVAFDGERIDAMGVRELLKKGAFLVAEDGTGRLVRADRVDPCVDLIGCVYVEVMGERSYLGLLSVDPERQGTGLGRSLVAAAEEYSRKAGCCAMDLRVISPRADELVPFYEHLAYVQTGTAPFSSDVKPKVPCHYITMAKALT